MNIQDCISVTYPLPGNDVGGRVMIYGLDRSKVDSAVTGGRMTDQTSGISSLPQKKATTLHVLFFCGGFPDHWTTFQPLAQWISAIQINTDNDHGNDRIICGVTRLP